MVIVLLWAAAASLSPTPAAQAPAGASLPAKISAAAIADDKVSCRNVKVVGTRIRQRVCHTEAEWREEERLAREALKDRERNPQTPQNQ